MGEGKVWSNFHTLQMKYFSTWKLPTCHSSNNEGLLQVNCKVTISRATFVGLDLVLAIWSPSQHWLSPDLSESTRGVRVAALLYTVTTNLLIFYCRYVWFVLAHSEPLFSPLSTWGVVPFWTSLTGVSWSIAIDGFTSHPIRWPSPFKRELWWRRTWLYRVLNWAHFIMR